MISDIIYFNREVLGIERPTVKIPSAQEVDWLCQALHEEVDEFEEGCAGDDVGDAVDGLLDLIYFAVGGLHRMGLTEAQINTCFSAVHEANLTKRKGVKATRPQDGSVADAVKSDEFQDPKIKIRAILNVD